MVTGELSAVLAHRRALRMTARLSDHFIICGFGRVGRQVARDLRAAGAKFVIVDGNPDNREHAGVGVRFILSTPSEDAALRDAGIERARAVLACVDSDLENIFIALTARELRPDISIVARAALEESESKLRRAGADRIISPYRASGAEMARLALHPNVTGSMDVATEYRLEEIAVTSGCAGVGRADRRHPRRLLHRRHPGRRRLLPAPAAVGDRAALGGRGHGDRDAAHAGAAGGAVRSRAPGARSALGVVGGDDPLGRLQAPRVLDQLGQLGRRRPARASPAPPGSRRSAGC